MTINTDLIEELEEISWRLWKGASLIEHGWVVCSEEPARKDLRKRLDKLLLLWSDLMGTFYHKAGEGCALALVGVTKCPPTWSPVPLCWHCAGGEGLPPVSEGRQLNETGRGNESRNTDTG